MIPLILLCLSRATAAPIVLSIAAPDVATVSTTLQEYQIPEGARWVQIYSATNNAHLQWSGTDGAAKSSDNLIIPADSWVEWRIPGTGMWKDHARATTSIFIAAATAGTSITVQCTSDGD